VKYSFHNGFTIYLYTSLVIKNKEKKMKNITKITLGLIVLASTTFAATNGATLFKKCVGCHGLNGEKKALGKSQVIKGWEESKTITALKGYKNGTYGGVMKGVMKGRVASLDEKQIASLAKHISTLK
jgi:cytochrome c553